MIILVRKMLKNKQDIAFESSSSDNDYRQFLDVHTGLLEAQKDIYNCNVIISYIMVDVSLGNSPVILYVSLAQVVFDVKCQTIYMPHDISRISTSCSSFKGYIITIK